MEWLVLGAVVLAFYGVFFACLGVIAWSAWRIANALEATHAPAEAEIDSD